MGSEMCIRDRREVSDRLVEQEGMVVPDTLPDDLTDPSLGSLAGR